MIQELRTFISVAKNGTFAAAGEKIGLTQSAVSSQIKRLEGALGYKLFDRTGRSAQLNEQGRAALFKAEEILAVFSRMSEIPSGEITEGVLNIGAISSVQSTVIARALFYFRLQFPCVRVRVTPGISMHLIDQMDTGQIDCAMIVRPPFGVMPEMSWKPLMREPFVLLVHVEAGFDGWRKILESEPFIRYERTSFGGRMVDRFLRANNIKVDEVYELDDIDGIVRMVGENMGVALLPLSESMLPFSDNVRVVPVDGDTFFRDIGLIHMGTKVNEQLVSQLVDMLAYSAEVSSNFLDGVLKGEEEDVSALRL